MSRANLLSAPGLPQASSPGKHAIQIQTRWAVEKHTAHDYTMVETRLMPNHQSTASGASSAPPSHNAVSILHGALCGPPILQGATHSNGPVDTCTEITYIACSAGNQLPRHRTVSMAGCRQWVRQLMHACQVTALQTTAGHSVSHSCWEHMAEVMHR